jgi:hypothetical protein
MKHPPLIALLLLAAGLTASEAAAGPLQDGTAHYRQNQIAEARRDYAAVLADPSAKPADKAAASRELGRLAWLIDADAPAAATELRSAIATGADVCASAALYARVLRESGQTAQATAEGARSLPACDNPNERVELSQQMMAAELDRAAASPADRAAALKAAADIWAGMRTDAQGDLDSERSALELALMTRDAPAALAAWKGYFWLTGKEAPQGMPAFAGRVGGLFTAGLAPDASVASQLELLDLLIRAGFDQAAHRFVDMTGLATRAAGQPGWTKAQAYFHFVDSLRSDLLALNRTLAKGGSKGDFPAFRTLMQRRLTELTGLSDPQAGRTAAQRDYGLNGVVQETGGYPALHLGHVIEDDKHRVEQFGRRGEVHFIAIDNMLSNGFESWLWDGSAEAGGWSEDGGSITQVRSAYAAGPVNAYAMIGDTPARRKALDRIASAEAADLQAARGGAVVPQASVSRRLRLQAVDAVAERARAKAGPGGDLRTAFLSEYGRISVDQSIFLHEGRHALDQAAKPEIGTLSETDLELRAKLSELELGEVPKMSLYQIDGDLLGGDTPHGIANARIVGAMRDWAAAHPDEVAGYDRSKPALSQIDKLSDAQIRAVAASLDPWAEKGGGG